MQTSEQNKLPLAFEKRARVPKECLEYMCRFTANLLASKSQRKLALARGGSVIYYPNQQLRT